MPDSLCRIIASSLKKNAGFPWKVITSRLWRNNFFFHCAVDSAIILCETVDLLTTESIRRNPFSSCSQLTHQDHIVWPFTFCHHSVITRGYAILKGDYPAGMNEKYRIRRLLIGCVRLVYLVYVQYTGNCKPFPSRLERPIENRMHRAICHGPSTK